MCILKFLRPTTVSLSFGSWVRKMFVTEAPDGPPHPGDGCPTWDCRNKSLHFLWAVSQLKLIIACLPDSCFICGPRASLGRKQSRSGFCLRVCAPWSGGGEVRREVRTRVQIELQEPFQVTLPPPCNCSGKANREVSPPPEWNPNSSICRLHLFNFSPEQALLNEAF